MDLGMEGKTVLVTGGAKGIGEAITRAFAAEGAVPVMLDRNPEEAAAIVADLEASGQTALSREIELTDLEALAAVTAEIVETRGGIDVIVHNAAGNDGVGLDAGPAAFRSSLERNLVHVYALQHFCLSALKASRGAVVNVGSKVADTGQGGTSGYAAAKGALNALTREWAVDLAPDGIRVNAVIPAEVMTPMYERWIQTQPRPEETLAEITGTIPLGRRFTTPAEIADTVVFAASPRSSHTTGQILYVDGGYTHFDRAATVRARP
ncbi:MAG: SDR family oxidoreductase [Akkermansiaceae bacterium]|nr:SDR family oxidoreductase [Akkermansiaceae bacterium]NNM28160.1 SDR family oxidoreductase [Akkermansiaceae bacterium]